MPNYDYKCKDCSHTFEVFQSMKAAHLKKCPECGGRIRRLIGKGAGIIFKKAPEAKPSNQCGPCNQTSCKNYPQNTVITKSR